jgi:RNA polymerase sigma-70 factor (ECF subfamily)
MSQAMPIEEVYVDYYQPLLRYLHRLVHDEGVAEDLCQDSFVKAMRHWDERNPQANLRSWLYAIARNTAFDYLRRRKRMQTETLDEGLATQAHVDNPQVWLEREPIEAAFNRLPEHHRRPLLYNLAGYDHNHIASVLGCPANTVKTRIFRARAQFRRLYT